MWGDWGRRLYGKSGASLLEECQASPKNFQKKGQAKVIMVKYFKPCEYFCYVCTRVILRGSKSVVYPL